jgi:hypothetical protein
LFFFSTYFLSHGGWVLLEKMMNNNCYPLAFLQFTHLFIDPKKLSFSFYILGPRTTQFCFGIFIFHINPLSILFSFFYFWFLIFDFWFSIFLFFYILFFFSKTMLMSIWQKKKVIQKYEMYANMLKTYFFEF